MPIFLLKIAIGKKDRHLGFPLTYHFIVGFSLVDKSRNEWFKPGRD